MPEKKEGPAYKRILLKLSGESLIGDLPYGIDFETTRSIAEEIKEVHELGVEAVLPFVGFVDPIGILEGAGVVDEYLVSFSKKDALLRRSLFDAQDQ